MFDLKDKVAIITGGASGIGAAAVRMFHQLGAKVMIGDIAVEQGEALADELGDNTACRVSTSWMPPPGRAPSTRPKKPSGR